MVRLTVLFAACALAASGCKGKVGVSKEEVEEKIQSAFAAKGFELASVTCPDGPLSGQVECTGTSKSGVDVPIAVDIQREGFLSNNLEFETRGVAVGFVVSQNIESSAKEEYGIGLEVECPDVVPEGKPMRCKGTFDGADVVVKYQSGNWDTEKGVVTAEALENALARIAAERGLPVERSEIDCGPARIYGAVPEREIACKAGERQLTLRLGPDGTGFEVVGEQ